MNIFKKITTKGTQQFLALARPIGNKILKQKLGEAFTIHHITLHTDANNITIALKALGEEEPFSVKLYDIHIKRSDKTYRLSFESLTSNKPWIEKVLQRAVHKRYPDNLIPIPPKHNFLIKSLKLLLPY